MFERVKSIFRPAGKPAGGSESKAGRASIMKLMPLSQVLDGYSSSPDWTQMRGRTMLDEGYHANTWAFACVRRRMQAVASVPLVAQARPQSGEWGAAPENDPIARLLDAPCPGLSGQKLLAMIVGQMDIQGAFYAKIIRGGRGGAVPLELWPMPIGSLRAVIKDNEIQRYVYQRLDGKEETLQPGEVLQIQSTHPDSKHVGMPPMLAGGKAIDVDNAAAAWQKSSMDNRGVPDGVFKLQGDDIGPDEYEEARRQVREQYSGMQNAREPWVLANAEFEQLSQTMADLDFMSGRRMSREEICAALDVPPPLVGIYDNATLSNIDTARQILWRDSLLPLLSSITDQMTRALAGDRRRVYADTTNVEALQESLESKVKVAKDMHGLGIPLTEINRRLELNLDLDGVSGAASAMMPSSVAPVAPEPAQDESNKSSDLELVMSISERVAGDEMAVDAGAKMIARAVSWLDEDSARELLESQGGILP